MRWFLPLLLLLTGCGPVLVMPRQQDVAAQSLSDIEAATDYVLKDENVPYPTRLAVYDTREHARVMSKALEIDVTELPRPRVTTQDWQNDPNAAHQISTANVKTDSDNIADYGWKAAGVVGALLIAARAGQLALGGTPFGQLFAFINGLTGGESPKRRKIHDKIISALEDYKELDPNWRTNKLYELLSSRMTTAEKDFIKSEIHD